MKHRYLYILAALVFFLAACSSDNDLTATPHLEPQFGTADEDVGIGVAQISSGGVYVLSNQTGVLYKQGSNGETYDDGFFTRITLRRYDATGKLIWTEQVGEDNCRYSGHYSGYDDECDFLEPKSVTADAAGNVYILSSTTYTYYNGWDATWTSYVLEKYNASGNFVDSIRVSEHVYGSYAGNDTEAVAALAIDSGSNILSIGTDCEAVEDEDGYSMGGYCTYVITKGLPTGNLLWQRTSTVGVPYRIAVSSTGNIYVVGSLGMARYSSTGNLIWTKKGLSYAVAEVSKIVASGSNLYVRSEKTVRKYDANGKLLWSKLQGGLNTLVFGDMTADPNGNVYITGKYRPTTSSPANVFVRKLRPTGATLWTKTFGTPQYDDGRGIATSNGSEIYVTGETQGSLAHTNIGGSDGYLRKLNSLGNQVWIR